MFGLRLLLPWPYAKAGALMFRAVMRHRTLLWNLSKREVRDRYIGQFLGGLWSVLTPALTIGVYLFIFGFVFQMRMPEGSAPLAAGWGDSYALYLISGLVPWLGMQDVLTRSVHAITANSNLVKQVIFPLEVLPLKMLWGAFVNQGIMLLLFLGYGWLRFGPPSPLLALLPVALFMQYLAAAGFALLFAAIAPFFRDIKDIISLLCFVLIYVMPIFYTPSMLPEWVWHVLQYNPFTHMVVCYHDILFHGTITAPLSWVLFPLFSLCMFAVGARGFQALKPHFGNVL